MGHHICALAVAEHVDLVRAAAVDLRPSVTYQHLTLLPVDMYYAEYWAGQRDAHASLDLPDDVPAIFPFHSVLLDFVREVTGKDDPRFAIVQTDYFGGAGGQWAVVFRGATRLTGEGTTINQALAALGIRARPPLDEFDTIGLEAHRHNPEYLDRYFDLVV
jgi:hypothetical protein